MKVDYTIEQINYIIYNNRTYEGVVKNFTPKLNFNELNLLLEVGKQLKFVGKLVNKGVSIVIDKEKLDLYIPDIQLLPEQLESIKIEQKEFSEEERKLLNKKNISKNIIEKYKISSLSQFNNDELKILGVTTHPILERLLGDGISDGLIIPLYEDNKLINTVFRKTNELTKLKYGLSVPSLDFWGDDILEGEEIWLCEGLFDMMALREQGKRCISASSCALNDFLYFKIIKNKPKIVNIFTDNDVSGYNSSIKSQKMFGLNRINSKIYHSKTSKDAAEHFFEKNNNWDNVEEITITPEMLNREENVFDFLKYLEGRKI